MKIIFKLVCVIAGGIFSFSSYAIDCSNIDEWVESQIYTKGDKTQFEKIAYQAKWWTRGDNPKINNETAEWPVWGKQGPCTSAPQQPNVGDTDIRPTRNNTNSIISIIKDDGYYTSTKLWCDWLKDNKLDGKITEGLITNKVNTENSWQKWRDLYGTGCLDIANHSHTHTKPVVREEEINGAKAILESKMPETGGIVLYIVPFGDVEVSGLKAKVKEQHWSMKGGYRNKGLNSLSPDPERWYTLFQRQTTSTATGSPNTTTLADMKSWVDLALNDNKFLIISTHSCHSTGVPGIPDINDGAWGAIPCEDWRGFFQYLGGKSGYWFEGVGLITKYIRERQSATVKSTLVNTNRITVSLTDTLPDALFNYPLLLRTAVPSNWGNANVKQGNGAVVTVEPVLEGGMQYVYYEAIPDQGEITVTRL